MKKKSILLKICIIFLLLGFTLVYWIAYNLDSPGGEENRCTLRFDSCNSLFVVIDTFTFGLEEVLITLPTGNFRDSTFLKNPYLFFIFIDSSANLKDVVPGDIMGMDQQDLYSILSTYGDLLKKSIDSRSILHILHHKKLILVWFIQKHREPNYPIAREMANKLFSRKMLSTFIMERRNSFSIFSSTPP